MKPGDTVHGYAFYNAPERKGTVSNPYLLDARDGKGDTYHVPPVKSGYLDAEDTPPTPAPVWFQVVTVLLGLGIIIMVGIIVSNILAK